MRRKRDKEIVLLWLVPAQEAVYRLVRFAHTNSLGGWPRHARIFSLFVVIVASTRLVRQIFDS